VNLGCQCSVISLQLMKSWLRSLQLYRKSIIYLCIICYLFHSIVEPFLSILLTAVSTQYTAHCLQNSFFCKFLRKCVLFIWGLFSYRLACKMQPYHSCFYLAGWNKTSFTLLRKCDLNKLCYRHWDLRKKHCQYLYCTFPRILPWIMKYNRTEARLSLMRN